MKTFFPFFLLCLTINLGFCQITNNENEDYQTISGKITYLGSPISNVTIVAKQTQRGTLTDETGNYSIDARKGDILEFSHVSFKTVSILVEDVTSVLNIEMIDKNNKLDEVVVNARLTQTALNNIQNRRPKTLMTSVGEFNPDAIAGRMYYVSGELLSNGYRTLQEALYGKVPGDIPTQWDIDGQLFKGNPPFIDISSVKDVFVLNTNLGTVRWGGPVVIVRTVNSPEYIEKEVKESTEIYKNQNFYQEDAITDETEKIEKIDDTKQEANQKNTVTGQITYLNAPVPAVSITIKDKNQGTVSDKNGKYKISASPGDILVFSHISFKSVSVMVEDVTKIINIKMAAANNALDEIVISTNNKSGKITDRSIKADEVFNTSMGTYDPRKSGYRSDYIDGASILAGYESLGAALDGRLPGVRYDRPTKKLVVKPSSSINTPQFAIWDVDGVIYQDEPQIDLNSIENIRVLKSVGQTNRYGSIAAGGVILVTTKTGNFDAQNAGRAKATAEYQNNQRYFNDAEVGEDLLAKPNDYLKELQSLDDKTIAYNQYLETIKNSAKDYSNHIGIAKMFLQSYNDPTIAKEILGDIETRYSDNSEVLKAVAYNYQAFGMKKEAIKTYQNIYYLRPDYNQSHRDVANAYIENEQFKRGWRLYMNYILEGRETDGEGIGSIIYNEMEYLFYNRSNQTEIKENFVPRFEKKDEFNHDVRLVFEWNTSEAEFEIEFVNPELRSYVFDHSLENNPSLIMEEKTKGYSSKEYLLDDIGDGTWLINLTYHGNKQPLPTYLKMTTYFNWGKFNQRQEISVYELGIEDKKIQLLRIDKEDLVFSN
ncbi:CarboxypepD_reg-like domain-containing protein [Flavobacteriaceae bacterium MAR_2010_188]|nr:CarboxypepD_reg-like domain-containing protein [Flavobacteriaceae bacterium MAR_2010_188]